MLYSLWHGEVQCGNYISVKFFDDIVNLFVRKEVTACGIHGRCQPQYIVEADGGVYPCDFYVLDEYCLGNLTKMKLSELFERAVEGGFLNSRTVLPAACTSCKYQKACSGGCKRMEKAMYVDDSGYCGYMALLDEILDKLCHVAVTAF